MVLLLLFNLEVSHHRWFVVESLDVSHSDVSGDGELPLSLDIDRLLPVDFDLLEHLLLVERTGYLIVQVQLNLL